MKGKITNFNTEKKFGFIKGEDRKSYFFHISNVSNSTDIENGRTVDFEGQKKEKGLSASEITVNIPLATGSKDKILKIDNLRIRASEIKDYEIISSSHDGAYKDEDQNSHYKFRTDSGGSKKIDGNYYSIKDMYNTIDNRPIVRKIEDIYYYDYEYEYYHPVDPDDYYTYLDFECARRLCYTVVINTYTSGRKYLNFITFHEDVNKMLADNAVRIIDEELEKLI